MSVDENSGNKPGKVCFCPSAWPELKESSVLGVVEDKSAGLYQRKVAYLKTPGHMAQDEPEASDALSTRDFRFAAPCMEGACRNWSGTSCQVAEHLVQIFPAVVDQLPACRLRPVCRWFDQEGGDACKRCPQVITDNAELISAVNQGRNALLRAASDGIFSAVAGAVAQALAGSTAPSEAPHETK